MTPRIRKLVIAVELLVGIGALFGGYGLLDDAEGLGTRDSWLEGSPFPDYRIPGLFLLVVIGVGNARERDAALERSGLAFAHAAGSETEPDSRPRAGAKPSRPNEVPHADHPHRPLTLDDRQVVDVVLSHQERSRP